MALRGQGSLQLHLGKSVFGAKKRKAGKKELDAVTKRQRTSAGANGPATDDASPPAGARPPLTPRLPRQQQPAGLLSNQGLLKKYQSRELQHSQRHPHQLHSPGLPTPPDGTGWIRIETNVVGLRFRRISSDAAATAAAAAAATATQLGGVDCLTSSDPSKPSLTSESPWTGGPRYRLAPEPTNPQDANAVQVLQCASLAPAADDSSRGNYNNKSRTVTTTSAAVAAAAVPRDRDLMVGYLPAVVAAHIAPWLRAGLLETEVHVCWHAREGAGSVPLVMYVRAVATGSDDRPGTSTTTSHAVVAATAPTSTVVATTAAATVTNRVSEARSTRGAVCGGIDASAADDASVDGCCDDDDDGDGELGAAHGRIEECGGVAGSGTSPVIGSEAGGTVGGAQASIQAALEAAAAAAVDWMLHRSSSSNAAGEVLRSNFMVMTEDVRRHDGHLLSPDEHLLLGRLLELPAPAQCLFLRLLLRKGPWFALTGIAYPECGDVAEAAEALVAAGLAARPQPDDWPQIAELLRVAEVRALAGPGSKPGKYRQTDRLIARRDFPPQFRSQQAQTQTQVPRKSSILAYTVSKDGAAAAAVRAGSCSTVAVPAAASVESGSIGGGIIGAPLSPSPAPPFAPVSAPIVDAADGAALLACGSVGGSSGNGVIVDFCQVLSGRADSSGGGGGGGGRGRRGTRSVGSGGGGGSGGRRASNGGSVNAGTVAGGGASSGGGGKTAAIEALRRRSKDCTAEISKWVEGRVGPCVRLSPAAVELVVRVQRLYFLAEGPAADLGRFLATERGVIRYPTYNLRRSSAAFSCRQQLLDYEQALSHAAQLERFLEAGDDDGATAALAPALAAVRAGSHRLVRWCGDATIPVRAVPGPWRWEGVADINLPAATHAGPAAAKVAAGGANVKAESDFPIGALPGGMRRSDGDDECLKEDCVQGSSELAARQQAGNKCTGLRSLESLAIGVSLLERRRLYGEAVGLLRQLLQGRCCPGRRGEWWMRMSVDLQHLGREEEALQVAEAALTDPWIRHGDRLALQRRVLRLGKPPRRWRRPPWAATALAEPREVVVSAIMMKGAAGVKSCFAVPSARGNGDSGGSSADGSSRMVSVEELALLHYGSAAGGGWRGVHSEGGVWTTLWALLFWEVLFMDVPGVFRSPFQTAPLDLDTDAFLPARREAVDARLQLIASGAALDLIRSGWSSRVGTRCRGINWERWTLEDLLQIAGCVGGLGLSVVCRLLCEDAGGWRGGMPDLLLWRPERGDAMVSEVKGPRDRLSDQQRAWLAALSAAGLRAEVLRIMEAPPPPHPGPLGQCRPEEDGSRQQAGAAPIHSYSGGGNVRGRQGARMRCRRAMAVPIVCENTTGETDGRTEVVGEGVVLAAAAVAIEAHSGMKDGTVAISDEEEDEEDDDGNDDGNWSADDSLRF
ncbi:hypothetical protein VaNZ11_016863 [Volvox africanus]|uniref:Fanconi-associated nuclease n=1 Tax=Volvox africanus TaxID=51714 RepID=A0ABQ5SQD5_9CHLO|nr:hypothetical protein VaNZ11_016863 [Volvox africanus]